MELKSLIVNDKEIDVEHPGYEGLVVTVAYIPRSVQKTLLEKSTVTKFDSTSKQLTEVADTDLFLELYVPKIIKGWKGFKYKYLADMLPVDLSQVDENDELEYTESNAIELMKNSQDFDAWITSVTNDVKNFNKSR